VIFQEFRKLLKKDSLNKIELLEATSKSLFLLGRYKQGADSLKMIKTIRNESSNKSSNESSLNMTSSNDSSKYHFNLGLCYRAIDNRVKAFEEFEASIALNPSDDQSLFQISEILLEDGKMSEAINYLRRGLQIFPDSPQLNLKLGILLSQLLITSGSKLGIEDTNAAGVCLGVASRVNPEGKLTLGALLQIAKSEDSIGQYRGMTHIICMSHIL
jgi:tetratricopeptide (TPR) repeat protein